MPDSPVRDRVASATEPSAEARLDAICGVGMALKPTNGRQVRLEFEQCFRDGWAAALSTLTLADHIEAVEASGTHYVEQRRVDEYLLPDTEGPTEAEWTEMRAWAVRSDLKSAIETVETSGTHVVVPVEPTEAMYAAGGKSEPFMAMDGRTWTPGQIVAATVYRAMLAARPRDAK